VSFDYPWISHIALGINAGFSRRIEFRRLQCLKQANIKIAHHAYTKTTLFITTTDKVICNNNRY
jgi:hypothetical protein